MPRLIISPSNYSLIYKSEVLRLVKNSCRVDYCTCLELESNSPANLRCTGGPGHYSQLCGFVILHTEVIKSFTTTLGGDTTHMHSSPAAEKQQYVLLISKFVLNSQTVLIGNVNVDPAPSTCSVNAWPQLLYHYKT